MATMAKARGFARVHASSASKGRTSKDLHKALSRVKVLRGTDGARVTPTELWKPDERAETGFPLENLLADPENAAYDAVGFYKGVQRTFFNPATPFAFRERMKDEGGMDDIRDVLSHWKPWIPPKLDQGLQQGGLLVFHGENSIFTHYDQATADHANMSDVFRALDA